MLSEATVLTGSPQSTVTFTGLTEGSDYVAWAAGSKYLKFKVETVPVVPITEAEAKALIEATTIAFRKVGLRSVAEKSANYTLTGEDDVIVANGTAGSFTLTLPTAVGIKGREYVVKANLSGVNVVTVATTSAQTIDGASTVALSLSATYKGITVVSDGANWWIV